MEDAACDLGGTVDGNVQREHAAVQPAPDARLPRTHVALDVSANAKHEAISINLAYNVAVNVEFAVGVENTRNRERFAEARNGRFSAIRMRRRWSRFAPRQK